MSDLEASEPPITEAPEDERQRVDANRSLWADAARDLARKPMFWAALIMVLIVSSMALFPGLWASGDPSHCTLNHAKERPSAAHPFGFTLLGCDMWAKAVYGASKSLAVALITTVVSGVIGIVVGVWAGFYGGITDTLLSRVTDVFFGLPFLLGTLVFLSLFPVRNTWTISGALTVLAWTTIARVMRGSVLATKNKDFVDAARAIGASNGHIIRKHILSNSIAPVIVLSTIALGTYVSAEATLTYLGVGFQQPNSTWGLLIAEGQTYALGGYPHLLIIPCAFVVVTVLSFILLGDMLRDALDPRGR